MLCPICDRDNPLDARRCKACGADFEDPEIAAQLERPAGRAGTSADADDEPNLHSDRYLGVRWIGLEVGGDLRRIAMLGGIAFALASLLPIALDFRHVRGVWSVLGRGPTFALVLPMVLAAIGIAIATPLGRKLPAPVTAGLLTVGGALVLGFAIAGQGRYSALPTRTWWGPWFGVGIVAAGILIRILRRRDPYARWIVVVGAALVVIGMFLPFTDGRAALPGEYALFMGDQSLLDTSVGGASMDGFDYDAMVRFLSMWHLLAIALVGAAVGFALPMSTGPWDTSGLVLRPLGWVIGFWVPATLALYTLNIMGWHGADWVHWQGETYKWDPFTTALFAGRARLVVLTIPAAAWCAIGLAGLYVNLVVPRLPRAVTK